MKRISLLLLLLSFVCGNAFLSGKTNKRRTVKIHTSAKALREGAPFDFPEMDEQIRSLRLKYDLPGVTVAVVRNDKLVYINCYGVEDVKTQSPVKNTGLFRIASISKPVTVVAVLRLIQSGKLSMDSRVFGKEGLLKDDFGVIPENSDWNKITVRHLIEHKSGIQNVPDDPMFSYKGLNNREVIARVIAERPLATEPGTHYYYSNTGYNILGRIIEKVSGMEYESYVRENVLYPCGIKRMRTGGNTQEERYPDEVVYEQPDEPGWTYGMDVSRMDSHGGWIASATDLARFIAHIDRTATVPDLVDTTLTALTYMNNTRWNHSGSLPGTATFMERMDDTFSFVILINKRSADRNFWSDIPTALRTAITARNSWPDIDLFGKIKW
ncbi:MAG: beta-lactamase family protein [Tannerella sp.]|jgi:CubicO group peptidase (beta-lactamase class C family)|nr:beta-lactamase family protein [Tannerella sp.]